MNQTEIKAAKALELLSNPRLQQAFTNVRENAVSQLESLTPGSDLQDELVIALRVLRAIKQDIENDILDAQMDAQDPI